MPRLRRWILRHRSPEPTQNRFSRTLFIPRAGGFATDPPKAVLKGSHVHPPASEAHTLRFEQEALLQGRFATQRNPASRAQNSLPRQAVHLLQNSSNVAGTARITSGCGDCSIRAHPSTQNLTDSVTNGIHQRRFGRTLKFHSSR